MTAQRSPLRIGHKGAARLAPPNSLAGLEAARAAGLDAVEFDVVAGRGGTLALGHDLREAAARATRLDAALALLASPSFADLRLLVDVKAAGIEGPLVAALRDHALLARALVCARHPAVLEAVRAHDADVRRGWSLRWPWHVRLLPGERPVHDGVAGALDQALANNDAEALMLHHSLVRARTVAAVHAEGGEVYAWTINSPRTLRRITALGVDGVVTDDPGVFDGR